MIYLIEVGAHDGAGEVTLYFSTDGYTSWPEDTPANTYFEPRVIDPGNFERHLFSAGSTRGGSDVGGGDIELASADDGDGGNLDYLLDYAFSGRRIVIKSLDAEYLPYSQAVTLFTGTCDQIVSDNAFETILLRISDRLAEIDKPLLTNRYGGTTTAGGPTADGTADMKDQVKQKLWGAAYSVEPVMANPFDRIGQLTDGPFHSTTLMDGGVLLPFHADYPTLAALQAATDIPRGSFGTCRALGYVRPESPPKRVLIADVVEGATAADRTAAQIARRILLHAGIPESELLLPSFAALDAVAPYQCSVVVSGDQTVLSALDYVLGSVGATVVPDHLGRFEVIRFAGPSAPLVMFDDTQFLGDTLERIAIGEDGKDIPVWSSTVRWGRLWRALDVGQQINASDGDIAGIETMTQARKDYLSTEWRQEVRTNEATKTRWGERASAITLDSALSDATAAAAESARLLALHGAPRDGYRVIVPLQFAGLAQVGKTVGLMTNRFGLQNGRAFVVIGRVDEYEDDQVELTVWG